MKKVLVLAFIVLGVIFVFWNDQSASAQNLVAPRVDTDGDGLFDFYERNVWGTDPRKADTDGDGYSDSEELKNGYDPLSPTPRQRYLAVTFSPVVRSQDLQVSGSSNLGKFAEVDTLVVDNISPFKYLQVEGVSYLGGTLVNPNENKPLTVGDNLRVDGRAFRGATQGPSDEMPFIIDDNLEITGDTETTNLKATENIETKNLAVTETGRMFVLQSQIIQAHDIVTNTISGEMINGTKGNFSGLDVDGKLLAGQGVGAEKDVDILGDLKVTGEIDSSTILITPTSSTNPAFMVRDVGGTEKLSIFPNGGLAASGSFVADGNANIGGNAYINGVLAVGGMANFGGGYSVGGSGVTIENNGDLAMNGKLTVDGAIDPTSITLKEMAATICDNANLGKIEFRRVDANTAIFYGCAEVAGSPTWVALH
jgi:hypothetical protein